jgi:hypothetical protein
MESRAINHEIDIVVYQVIPRYAIQIIAVPDCTHGLILLFLLLDTLFPVAHKI